MVVVNNRHTNITPLTEGEKREQHSSSKRRGGGEIENDNGGCKLCRPKSSRKRRGRGAMEHNNGGCKRRRAESSQSSRKRRGRGEIENDNGGCNRRRPESRRTLTNVKEEVRNKRIRLFKWKESLLNDKYPESDTGIIMVYVNKNIKDRTQNPDGTIVEQETEKNYIKSVMFKLELFQNIGDFIHSLAVLSVSLEASNAFEKWSTIKALADEISTHISSNFRFTKRNFSCPRAGRVVIFVEVDMFTSKEYRVINIDAESIMAMDGTDQEENNDQQSYLYVQLEEDSMDPDREETGEEVQVKGDDMEDDSEVVLVSSPELMKIEGMLWRCVEDWTEFIRVDPDYSRDSKGLKQVEDAITEFHGNEKKLNAWCPCCLEGFCEGAVKTRCRHLFHRHCLCSWLSIKDSCPLCRSPCATLV